MIGKDIYDTVFRDTKNFYDTMPAHVVSRPLVHFLEKYAGHKILDLGCATGNYCLYLSQKGFETTGVDINEKYVEIAKSRGVNAYHIHNKTHFEDKSFDTVMIIEVLEHLPEPSIVLKEAKRLARKNVLITTPNCNNFELLRTEGLLFEHFADKDHRNFFTPQTMKELLLQYFPSVTLKERNPINPFALFSFSPIRIFGKVLTKLKIFRPKFNYRLFAVCAVE